VNTDKSDIKAQAQWEIELETFENLVEIEKRRIRKYKPWWKKVFPYKISITREE